MTNRCGRRQSGVRVMCLAGDGSSFAWGVHSGSVKAGARWALQRTLFVWRKVPYA